VNRIIECDRYSEKPRQRPHPFGFAHSDAVSSDSLIPARRRSRLVLPPPLPGWTGDPRCLSVHWTRTWDGS